MPGFNFQSSNAIRLQIKNTHQGNGYNLEQDYKDELDDFANIGSLMTDAKTCLGYLQQLNDALVMKAKAMGVLNKMTTDPSFFQKIITQPSHTLKQTGSIADRESGKTFSIHKHHKVLTTFFAEWESKHGFNTGTLVHTPKNSLPNSAPTLRAFVSAEDFRNYLFKYAYHWKDAGVGWRHGEFTHRIHWYLVIEHAQKNLSWLHYKPNDLFRACAEPQWVHKNKNKGVWDDIFDNANVKTDFRSPEVLHAFLKDASDPKHPDHKPLWLLAQLIMGRAAKRLQQMGQGGIVITVPQSATLVGGTTQQQQTGQQPIMWKHS